MYFIKKLQGKYERIQCYINLTYLKLKSKKSYRHQLGKIILEGCYISYIDTLSLYMEYKDIFYNKIYHFESHSLNPYIIDGGGYVGMSTLYFKSIYPEAEIVCFEPDANIFKTLKTNVEDNNLTNIKLVQAGLAANSGTISFLPDGLDGGKITNQEGKVTIQTVCLSDYLDRPVDFLKLNIEGQELPVLLEAESSGKLHNVKELVLEYHGWAGEEQRLGKILDLLDRNSFRYLIHDFDAETNGHTKPPFNLRPQKNWFCLVYAKRLEEES
jgi:FkbM family methyltransferase